uniref:Vps53 N-terminal domain-containing protein n=1 Tax=Brassica oleracea var. oleracea TaxID=109376 RepID=A0A0D3BMG4_BRAOL
MDKSSALEYINQMFPTEASLSGVEPLMQKIHGEIRRVDATILSAVRQQSNSGTKAKEDLADATRAVEELSYKIREIKSKAEQSETMVQETCRDIKKLDFAKKNITTTITALHRLTMLVSAVEQLQVMASKRQYKEAAAQLEAVSQLCNHFEAYRDVPKITELRQKLYNIKQILKSHVFSDFSSLGTGKETEETNLLQHLSDCCLVVDALESSVREEVVNNFCSRELTSYEQIFEGAELARLDKTERRYAWIKRRIRTNEEIWKIFPASWHVPYRLCIQFCKKTRKQVESILVNMKEKPEAATLLQALQSTVEFEKELENKFGGDVATRDIGDDIEEIGTWENSSQNVSKIRKKYEKKFAAGQESGESGLLPLFQQETTGNKDLSVPGAGFNFRGIISSCFEPHLTPYIELEEKTLMEHLEKVVQLFTDIKKSLKRCSVLSKNQTLFNLFKVYFSFAQYGFYISTESLSNALTCRVFQRVLKAYATKLFLKLPKGGTGIVAAATAWTDLGFKCRVVRIGERRLDTRHSPWRFMAIASRISRSKCIARKGGRLSYLALHWGPESFWRSPQVATRHGERSGRLLKPRDGQIKVSDRDERVICHIVNSSEYCHKTCGELAEKVSEIIDPHYVDVVDISEVQDEFSAVIRRSLVTLVLGIETKFDTEMAAMTRVPWGTLDCVGDQSGYVNGINTILSGSIPVLGNLLTPVYFQFFLDKLASSLGPRFYANIFRCKQLSEAGAQQMLLDTQAMKTILLEIPSLARQLRLLPATLNL